MKMRKILLRLTATASLLLLYAGMFVPHAHASQALQDYYNKLQKYRTTPAYSSTTPGSTTAPGTNPTTTPGTNPATAPGTNPTTTPGTSPTTPPEQSTPANQPGATLPAAPSGLTAAEARLFQLLNSARSENGVPPLEVDMRLVEAARAKACDLVTHNAFSHTSPTYGTVSQLLNTFGIRYQRYGETLAKAADVSRAHLLLINSTSHRQIMLNPSFTKVGVAVIPQGNWVMVVELFIKP
ncbi:MAG: CAP domain-containing protein [Desulfurispora sp.]|uniref:CAP domain-containing protein n=1 Tax=Desulfurispora sp. TaxID=3014275 RepID=UPI004049D012